MSEKEDHERYDFWLNGSHIAVRYLPSRPETADLESNIASGFSSATALLAVGVLLLSGMLTGAYKYVADYFC